MKLLVVSNLYPPEFIGGYELGCKMLVDEFIRQGVDVTVLTSGRKSKHKSDTHRLFPFFGYGDFRSAKDVDVFADRIEEGKEHVQSFMNSIKANCILLFSPSGVPTVVTEIIQQSGLPIAALISDDWPANESTLNHFSSAWLSHGRNLTKIFSPGELVDREASYIQRGILGIPSPWSIQKAFFVSNFLRASLAERFAKVPKHDQHVIHWGLPDEPFSVRSVQRPASKILYCSQLVEKKGAFDLVTAVGLLRSKKIDVQVTMVGTSPVEAERQRLEQRIKELGLGDRITINDAVPRDRLVGSMMGQFDIFTLGSLNQEPFSIAALEAMRAGLGVVTTATGGGVEIFRDGENCRIYKGGNPGSLAAVLEELVRSESLLTKVTQGARRTVQNYTLSAMASAILEELRAWKPRHEKPSDAESCTSRYLKARLTDAITRVTDIRTLNSIIGEKDVYLKSLEAAVKEKETHIESLTRILSSKEDGLRDIEESIRKKDEYVSALLKTIDAKEVYVHSLLTGIQAKEVYAKSLEQAVSEKEAYAKSLEQIVNEKDLHAHALASSIAKKDEYGKALEQALREKDVHLQALQKMAGERDVYANSLLKSLKEKDSYIDELTASLREKDQYAQSLLTGITAKDSMITSLQQAVQDRETYVKSLESSTVEKDEYARSLESAIKQKEAYTLTLVSLIAEKDTRIAGLEAELKGKSDYSRSLEKHLKEKTDHIQAMEKTFAFKIHRFFLGK